MLHIRVHYPGEGRLSEALEAGTHDMVKLIPGPADFVSTLKEEFHRPGKGRMLVIGTGESFINRFAFLSNHRIGRPYFKEGN